MRILDSAEKFDQAIENLSGRLRDVLRSAPLSAKQTAQEIRLRVGAPVALTCPAQTWFVGREGELHNQPQPGMLVTKADIADSVIMLCGHSVHSHQHEIRNGFITLRGGHRAGLCGTAVLDGGTVSAVREVTSLNLRIAREIPGAADALMDNVFGQRVCGLLLAGPPSSGKTTLLRDLARQLSSGKSGRFYRVAVVDERGEIGAVYEGQAQHHLGPCCDILNGYPKGTGILMAVRTLSPQVIVCDEIGASAEVDSILDGLNCGVTVIASAHASSMEELLRRKSICRLLEHGAFARIALLSGDTPGNILDILEVGEQFAQDRGVMPYRSLFLNGWDVPGLRLVRKGGGD